MKPIKHITTVIAALLALLTAAPETHAQGCENFRIEGVAQLGLIEVAPGVFVLGALPTPVVIAGIPGTLGSVVTSARSSGSKGQGAMHFTLVHTFVSTDPLNPGSFTTEDRAVASPSGKDPNTGVLNDVMTIVNGSGVFANATGVMINHAFLDLTNQTLTFSTHGRICADGLE